MRSLYLQLLDETGHEVAYLHDRSSGLFGGEKCARASLEVNDDAKDILDDAVVSCIYLRLLGQRAGVPGMSEFTKVLVRVLQR